MNFYPTTLAGWSAVAVAVFTGACFWYQYVNVMEKFTPKYSCHFKYSKQKSKLIVAEIFLDRMEFPYYLQKIILCSNDNLHIISYKISSEYYSAVYYEKDITFEHNRIATGLNHLIQAKTEETKSPIKLEIYIPYSDTKDRTLSLLFRLDIMPYRVRLDIKIPDQEYNLI